MLLWWSPKQQTAPLRTPVGFAAWPGGGLDRLGRCRDLAPIDHAGQSLLTDPFSGDVILNSSNLTFSPEAGPRLSFVRQGPAGWGFEVTYFGIDGWDASAEVPNSELPSTFGSLAIDRNAAISALVTDVSFSYRSRL